MTPTPKNNLLGELSRVLLLTLAVWWLASPFRSECLVGGGDALWYQHQVDDALTQFRAGVFPLQVGQSDYAFNGAVHPIRSAPLLLHACGVVDFLTGRKAEAVHVLNLTILLCLVLAAVSAYGALVWLSPGHRWRAALLAWIYVACPGLVGLVYSQDLYMSIMVAPWLPWVAVAACEFSKEGRSSAALILGATTGALWWSHAPIALWTGAAVAAVLAGRAVLEIRTRNLMTTWLKGSALAGVCFALVAAYPLYSVLSLRAAGEAVVPAALDRAMVLREINGVFPAILMPIRESAGLLASMQPGYAALAGILLGAAAGSIGWRTGGSRWLVVAAVGAGLMIFILPIPGLTQALWECLPQVWVNMTNSWPSQRIAIIVAVFGIAAWQGAATDPKFTRISQGLILLAALWATHQAFAVRTLAEKRIRPAAETAMVARPENAPVSAYCYQQLPVRPGYFCHGVTSAEMELRFLSPVGLTVAYSNRRQVEAQSTAVWENLRMTPQANPGIFRSEKHWTLQPSEKYLLTFDFAHEDSRGILRLIGQTLQRAYILPDSGDPLAFGCGPKHERSLVVWTTRSDMPEGFHIEFIPEGKDPAAFNGTAFAKVRLTKIDRANLPARIERMIPLTISINTPVERQIETPRVFVPGWAATLDGKRVPVQRSSEGLVAVNIPAGRSQLELVYEGPRGLSTAFAISGLGLLATALALGGITFRYVARK